jgi:hypothetical protein
MPMLCAAFSCVVSAREAQRRCINPFPSSTTPLTRLFDRSEAVESRVVAAVSGIGEVDDDFASIVFGVCSDVSYFFLVERATVVMIFFAIISCYFCAVSLQ